MPALGKRAKGLVRRILPDTVHGHLRQRHIARLVERYESWDRTGLYGGDELTVHISDPLSEGWYGHDWPALPEVEMLRTLGALREGDFVFDLGAHQGVVALLLAREVGPSGCVLAVEAEVHNVRTAETNMVANHAVNVHVVHAAVSDRDGVAFFAESLNGTVTASRTGAVEVPAWTVDTLADSFGSPDLVFMDIEGYEGRALASCERTIDRGATFFVEVHVETLVGATPVDIVRFFPGRRIHIAADPTDDSCDFTLYDGGRLPTRRFFLIAT